jgi:hypothetical protein
VEGHKTPPAVPESLGWVGVCTRAGEAGRNSTEIRASARRVCDSVDVTVEADPNDYQRLDPDLVVQTLQRLQHRIVSRFPDRGLSKVAGQLATMADQIARSVDSSRNRLHRTRRVARALSVLVVLVAVIVLALALGDALTNGPDRSFEWLPLIESTINDIVFAAIAVFFLNELPNRLERRRLLPQLHRLRSLAHIVDMHQLTKAPERLRPDSESVNGPADDHLSRDAMERYLDYCSEMLSLVGKIAALCAEESQDSVVLETVSTIENLTTGMSRKIWQKISLLPTD